MCVVFNDLKRRRFQPGQADLKKQQTLEILLMINVLHIFEISHFSRFLKIISKSSVAHAKMVECI